MRKELSRKEGTLIFFGRKNPHFDNQTHSYFLSLSANEIIISRWCSTCQCHSLMVVVGWAHYKKLEENGFRIFTPSYFEGETKEALFKIYAPQK